MSKHDSTLDVIAYRGVFSTYLRNWEQYRITLTRVNVYISHLSHIIS